MSRIIKSLLQSPDFCSLSINPTTFCKSSSTTFKPDFLKLQHPPTPHPGIAVLYINNVYKTLNIENLKFKNIDNTLRVLPLLKKNIDYAVIYKSDETIKLINYYINTNKINENQIIYLDFDKNHNEEYIIEIIRSFINLTTFDKFKCTKNSLHRYDDIGLTKSSKNDIEINHLQNSNFCKNLISHVSFQQVILTPSVFLLNSQESILLFLQENNIKLLNDIKFPYKSCLYKTINNILPDFYIDNNIKTVKGFYCRNKEELLLSYYELKKHNINNILIKPVTSTSGNNIIDVNNINTIEDYNFDYGYVNLEEKIILNNKFPVLHFIGKKDCLDLSEQIVINNSYSGVTNIISFNNEFDNEINNIKKILIDKFQLNGFWGVDFLVSKNNELYLNDINCGRLNGSHFPKIYIINNYSNEILSSDKFKYIMRIFYDVRDLEYIININNYEHIKILEPNLINKINIDNYNIEKKVLHYIKVSDNNYKYRVLWVFIPK
jgi:hypothetical protein